MDLLPANKLLADRSSEILAALGGQHIAASSAASLPVAQD
jgi:hypothetical protein